MQNQHIACSKLLFVRMLGSIVDTLKGTNILLIIENGKEKLDFWIQMPEWMLQTSFRAS